MEEALVHDGIDENLLRFLRSYLGDETLGYRVPPRRFEQGMFSDVQSFTLTRGPKEWAAPLVLRMLPFDADPEQLSLETAVQNGLARIGVPAPFVLLVHDRIETLGRMFMVMERRPGRPSLKGVRWDLFASDLPKLFVSWPATIAAIARYLHSCEPGSVLDEAETRGINRLGLSPERRLRFVEDRLSCFGGQGMTHALAWLRDHQPEDPKHSSVLHGDLWPANVLRHRGLLTGLVDWERAAVGDPALDIGFAKVGLSLLPAPVQVPAPIRQAINAAGRSMAARLEDQYNKQSPLSPERVRYYEALRCAVELAIVASRLASDEPGFARSGWYHGQDALTRHFGEVTGTSIPRLDPCP
jgi:aminoglycoside phosphotransferase (APT) family kinase protein